ncbi:hypothetical protein [Bradyrhizobium sp. USDA 10063]
MARSAMRIRELEAAFGHCAWAMAALILLGLAAPALAKDKDDDDTSAKPTPTIPNIYLDLRTNYAKIPAGALAIGFGNTVLVSTLQTIQALSERNLLRTIPSGVSSPASEAIGVEFPLTVDVTDQVSLFGGVAASSTKTDLTDWSSFAVNSWNLGFQADLHEQNGGSFPTVTLLTTVTRAVPDGPLATTTFSNVLEFNYAFDEDETKGLLAGVQYTGVDVDSPLARINSSTVGYVGGYYQWENNWKVTGRIGLQSFGGAQLLNLKPIEQFTQPVLRLDLDRMDDNDNRLFGVTAQIVWVPKPAYVLTLRTPLYAVRN